MSKRDDFIAKAKACHNDGEIDYSEVVYVNSKTNVKLIDVEYGVFYQTPSNHLKGQRHPMRRGDSISSSKAMSQDEFIRRAEEVHKGEGLDYSKVVYKNMHSLVKIIDPIYGEYEQEACVHLRGCGHPRRGIERNADRQRYTTERFVELAKGVFGEYDYSMVEYRGSKEKVKVVCHKVGCNGKEHGEFWAYPDLLLQGKGCPKCGNHLSYGENEIGDYIVSLGFDVVRNDKSALGGLEIDVFVPSKSIGFEFDGLRWHSEPFKSCSYHQEKTLKALERGIFLIHIYEDEWRDKKEIVKHKISHMLGCDMGLPRIAARKCEIREIDGDVAKWFLNAYHIQGYAKSTVYLGCFFGDMLVGVMSFMKRGEWELTRFASDWSYVMQGVASRMFKYFVRKYEPNEVKTFLDARWRYCEANVYDALGFLEVGLSKPNYGYTNGMVRRHKFGFRKPFLVSKYGLSEELSEVELAREIGYTRIWNCGLYKYVWKNSLN